MLLPLTVAVPTVVPPDVQVLGSVEGPKTVKVMVPVAVEPEELANTELIEEAGMAVPAVPVAGPVEFTVGDDLVITQVSVMLPAHPA